MQETFKAGEKVRVIGRAEVGTVLGVNFGRVGVRYNHENGAVTHGNYDLKYVERVEEEAEGGMQKAEAAAKPKATTKDILPTS
jgi:hypothetical protein